MAIIRDTNQHMRRKTLQRIQHQSLVYYQFDSFDTLRHGVFTRHGGVSAAPFASLNFGGNVGDEPDAVRENYRRAFDALNLNHERACRVWQVHGTHTVVVKDPHPQQDWLAQADAMVTNIPDTPLTMRFADCIPILLHDPQNNAIGIAHAGWRGTVQGVGVHALNTMQAHFGTDPQSVRVGIGPGIGPERYQVGEEVVEAIADHFGSTDGLIQYDPADDSAYLNLWEANARDLRRCGVQHIEIAQICTASNTAEFYSHRAEKGKTGRFAAFISL